MNNHVGKMITL